MSASPYSVAKLAWHPDVLEKLRQGRMVPPLLVQWFVTHRCNQSCSFCAFGSGPPSIRAKVPNPPRAQWKNQKAYDPIIETPRHKMLETVAAMQAMGVKAVEVSGGGEPLAYTHFDELLTTLRDAGLEVSLVTNGTLLDRERADLLASIPFIWARVSIDAGDVTDYVATRHVPRSHWIAAWTAVELLAARRVHPECRVGVGFVVDRDNWRGVYECARRAKDRGADNIRISMSFTPEHEQRWAGALESVREQAQRAKADLGDATFTVNDLTAERTDNVRIARQEYPWCMFKDVGCVIGADLNVWSCCSLAFNPLGLMGTIRDKTFQEMWEGEGRKWREAHDPRRDCPVECLYESRNKTAIRLLMDRTEEERVRGEASPPHINYV